MEAIYTESEKIRKKRYEDIKRRQPKDKSKVSGDTETVVSLESNIGAPFAPIFSPNFFSPMQFFY
jgi:hypothetical protein